MERLTRRMCGGWGVVYGCELNTLAGAKAVVDRLAAYEDTGLEPEEIERIVDAYGRGHTLRTESAERLEIVREIKTDRLRELADAEQDDRLVVLPFPKGSTLVDHSDPERPELIINFRIAAAYDHRGIVFHQPFNIFMENVECGYISSVSKEAEAALAGNATIPPSDEPEWKQRMMSTFLGGR